MGEGVKNKSKKCHVLLEWPLTTVLEVLTPFSVFLYVLSQISMLYASKILPCYCAFNGTLLHQKFSKEMSSVDMEWRRSACQCVCV